MTGPAVFRKGAFLHPRQIDQKGHPTPLRRSPIMSTLLVLGTFTVCFLSAQDRKAVGKVTLSSGKVEEFAFLDKPYPRDRFEFCNDVAELIALKNESEARSVAASEVKGYAGMRPERRLKRRNGGGGFGRPGS